MSISDEVLSGNRRAGELEKAAHAIRKSHAQVKRINIDNASAALTCVPADSSETHYCLTLGGIALHLATQYNSIGEMVQVILMEDVRSSSNSDAAGALRRKILENLRRRVRRLPMDQRFTIREKCFVMPIAQFEIAEYMWLSTGELAASIRRKLATLGFDA